MTALYHPRPERWPQVSLRTFFVLVTLLCVAIGWMGVQVKWISDRQAARRSFPGTFIDPRHGRIGNVIYSGPHLRAPWPLYLLGENGVTTWEVDLLEDDPQIERLRKLFPEAGIRGMKRP